MSSTLHRRMGVVPPRAVRGEGIHLIDGDGRRYIDASGGPAVSCLGHGHPRVVAALQRQAADLAYAHTSFFTTDAMERLSDRLIEDAPAGLTHVLYVCGGSEAVESAVKLALQYHIERGEPGRRNIIARRQSYHGNTLAALSIGGSWRRALYGNIMGEGFLVDPCFPYRHQAPDETAEDYGRRAAASLEAQIQSLGAENVAAFIVEPVAGGMIGCVPPAPGYLREVRAICDRHGVLLIFDEIMCGMGRTGTLHAAEPEGAVADLVTIAKGLGGGYQPIGAVLVAGRVVEAIAAGSGNLMQGHTYMGHAVGCAAALAVQETIRDDDLLANVRRQGASLMDMLRARFGNHPYVGDIRGRGLFIGIELVADRGGKEPFDPALGLHVRVKKAGMARGLMTYPGGGTVDGRRGDHVVLAPPFIVTESDLPPIVDRLAAAIDAALSEVGARPG